jgi:hypothetical protein
MVTALQTFEFHRKAFAGADATLQELITDNLERDRKPWQSPHMKRYYVQVARLQNRMILSNRRRLVAMAQGADIPRPARRPYVPKPRRAPEQPFANLTPLEIALAQEAPAPAPLTPLVPTPWPEGELVQGALF